MALNTVELESSDEVASSKLPFPVPIGVDLVDEHGALLAAVPGEVALTVTVDVEPAHPARTGDGRATVYLSAHLLRLGAQGDRGADHRLLPGFLETRSGTACYQDVGQPD